MNKQTELDALFTKITVLHSIHISERARLSSRFRLNSKAINRNSYSFKQLMAG